MKWKPIFLSMILATHSWGAVNFSLEVLPELTPYLKYLNEPSRLVLLAGNAGIPLSFSGKPKLLSKTAFRLERKSSFPFRGAKLEFKEKRDSVYVYDVVVDWGVGEALTKTLTVQVDTSSAKSDNLVRLTVPGVLPERLKTRIEQFVANRLDPPKQALLARYLADRNEKESFESILIEALNSREGTANVSRPGDEEPISDQIFVIVSLFLWFILLPVVLAVRYWRKRSRHD